MACTVTGEMMTSRPELLSKAMSGSVILLGLGSMMMSLAHVAIEVHRNYAY